MADKKIYRIFCITENKLVSGETFLDEPPSLCPNNPAHEVNADSKCIVEYINVNLYTDTVDPTGGDDISQGFYVGSRWLNIDSRKEFVCLDNTEGNAIWITIISDTVGFQNGYDYNYVENDVEVSTNGDEWIQKLQLSLTGIPEGDYRIAWNFAWRSSKTSNIIEVKIEQNDEAALSITDYEAKDTSMIANVSGFKNISLSTGDHHIDMDFRKEDGPGTVYIKDARLEIWRIN